MSWTVNSFQADVPEIYQLEITNSCNLSCPACIREDPRVKRPIGYMKPELVQIMLDRGDFDGSYFVELQQYGEPLLHPQFNEIVSLLSGQNFKIGMSTNGILIQEHLSAISNLDYLTISLDSAFKDKYENLRPGSSYDKLVASIDKIAKNGPKPKIDLQTIRFGEESGLNELARLVDWFGWQSVTCREVPDCFAVYQGRPYPEEQRLQLCLNPWLSVSVQWDGDVVACCFSAGKHIVYGNLYETDLKTIWQTSDTRKALMFNMRLNGNIGNMPCQMCYLRSPVLFHQRMLMENIRT